MRVYTILALLAASDAVCAAPVVRTSVADSTLAPLAYKPAPLGDVKPSGWVLSQLELQAAGLSGHLGLFWPDVNDSIWIGGVHDGGPTTTDDHDHGTSVYGASASAPTGRSRRRPAHDSIHERGPYWLNGVVPLAALLEAAGSKSEAAVSVKKQADSWIQYILAHRNTSTGWLGPDDDHMQDYWSGWNIIHSLLQYAEAHAGSKVAAECLTAALAHCVESARRQQTMPLSGWAQVRWQDWGYILELVLDTGVGTDAERTALMQSINSTMVSGFDWDAYYNRTAKNQKFPVLGVASWNMVDHGVNNAMATKLPAVQYRMGKDRAAALASTKLMRHQQMRYHGQPYGMFSADEVFGGRDLNRGIELCAVVEQMYSYQTLFRTFGSVEYLDQCERIAYNALPGTITPNMWQHQYLQLANELNAAYGESEHSWNADGPDSTGMGVEPNFGCCTANFNQGWPKLATNTIFTFDAATAKPGGAATRDDGSSKDAAGENKVLAAASTTTTGIAIGIFLPSSATISIPLPSTVRGGDDGAIVAPPTLEVDVSVVTDYPFGDSVTIKVTVPPSAPPSASSSSASSSSASSASSSAPTTVPLQIRIPGWSTAATLSASSTADAVGYSPLQTGLKNGTMTTVAGCCTAGATTTVTLALHPTIEVETGWGAKLPSKEWPADENHTVSEGYGYFAGAALAGGDLRHANATWEEATQWCNNEPLCVTFSFPNKVFSKNASKHSDPTHKLGRGDVYFKSTFVMNTDPHWSTWLRIDAPGFGQPTNAAAVVRGPLVFARRLDQKVAIVKTWPTFNNTDQNVTLDAAKTGAWNHALVLDATNPAKHMTLATHTAPGPVPFDIQKYPLVIQAKARQVDGWGAMTGLSSFAAEPPASPVDCSKAANGCAAQDVTVELVPYGATNLRLSGLPWVLEPSVQTANSTV